MREQNRFGVPVISAGFHAWLNRRVSDSGQTTRGIPAYYRYRAAKVAQVPPTFRHVKAPAHFPCVGAFDSGCPGCGHGDAGCDQADQLWPDRKSLFGLGRDHRNGWKNLAPRAGFEPATNRLTAGCSTAELPGNTGRRRIRAHRRDRAISKVLRLCKETAG